MEQSDTGPIDESCSLRYSIIINNYNYGQYLREAVDSALAQTLPAYEIIIVDDGSTDNSLEVLKAYSDNPKIKVFTQKNGGQYVAIAEGIERATGDIHCMLDADDTYKPQYLAEINKVYALKPYVDLVFTRLEPMGPPSVYDENPDVLIWLNPKRDYDYGYTAIISYFCSYACFIGNVTSTISFRRKVAKFFFFRQLAERFPAPHGTDGAILLSASLFGYRKYLVYKQLINYRTHHESLNHQKRTSADQAAFDFRNLLMYRRYANFYKGKAYMGPEFRADLNTEFSLVPNPSRSHADIYQAEIKKAERESIAKMPFFKRMEHQFRQLRRRLFGKKTFSDDLSLKDVSQNKR